MTNEIHNIQCSTAKSQGKTLETYKNGEKAGKEKDISFASVCSGFAHKFFPDIIKGKSKQEMSFKEKMLAKYKK